MDRARAECQCPQNSGTGGIGAVGGTGSMRDEGGDGGPGADGGPGGNIILTISCNYRGPLLTDVSGGGVGPGGVPGYI
jgi:hypothetical protein